VLAQRLRKRTASRSGSLDVSKVTTTTTMHACMQVDSR
jgi:hypothetical protein